MPGSTTILGRLLAVQSYLLLLCSATSIFYGIALIHFYKMWSLYFATSLFVVFPYATIASGGWMLVCSTYSVLVSGSMNVWHLQLNALLLFLTSLSQLIMAVLALELRLVIQIKSLGQADIFAFARAFVKEARVRRAWDALQSQYYCCGGSDVSSGYHLWQDVSELGGSVPDSCCLMPVSGCGFKLLLAVHQRQLHQRIHTRGCMAVIDQTLDSDIAPQLRTYTMFALVLAMLGLISMMESMWIARRLRSQLGLRRRRKDSWISDVNYDQSQHCHSLVGQTVVTNLL